MAVLRKAKKERFTVIDNCVFFDSSLSYKAKGLLCQMLALPDPWDFSIEGLATLANDGRRAVASALTELEEHGYLHRERVREGNKIVGVDYIVSETPIDDFVKAQNVIAQNVLAQNSTQLNTKELNTKELNTKTKSTGRTKAKRQNANLHNDPSLRPTLDEVEAYISEKGLDVNGKTFFDFFDAGEWVDSKGNPVQNWKQKLITWSKNDNRGSNTERKGVRGAVRAREVSQRDGTPEWYKPFKPYPIDE